MNMKVLLRERKRHTARRRASTRCGWGKRGYLPWPGLPTLAGSTYPGQGEGYLPWPGEVPTLTGRYLLKVCTARPPPAPIDWKLGTPISWKVGTHLPVGWKLGYPPPPGQPEGRYPPTPISWKVGTPPKLNRHTPVKT